VAKPADPAVGGTLFVVATPLGNLADVSLRAVDVLKSVDAIAAEDTRRTRKLLSHFEIRTPLVPYHEHNEERAARRIVKRLLDGDDVALVSDAGTPLIADPGYSLVRHAVREGIDVVPIPGPSAVAAALSVAGVPPLPFYFAGFLPRRSAARKRKLRELSDLSATLAFYESPHRIAASLSDMAEVLGDRDAAVARELTKIHEEVLRAPLPELAESARSRSWKGEIVVLVAGAAARRRKGQDPP
jgi:16S rRNA (cytidine1402-2'-O)-methyltransferase